MAGDLKGQRSSGRFAAREETSRGNRYEIIENVESDQSGETNIDRLDPRDNLGCCDSGNG